MRARWHVVLAQRVHVSYLEPGPSRASRQSPTPAACAYREAMRASTNSPPPVRRRTPAHLLTSRRLPGRTRRTASLAKGRASRIPTCVAHLDGTVRRRRRPRNRPARGSRSRTVTWGRGHAADAVMDGKSRSLCGQGQASGSARQALRAHDHRPPAAADVEQVHARLQAELVADEIELGELGFSRCHPTSRSTRWSSTSSRPAGAGRTRWTGRSDARSPRDREPRCAGVRAVWLRWPAVALADLPRQRRSACRGPWRAAPARHVPSRHAVRTPAAPVAVPPPTQQMGSNRR